MQQTPFLLRATALLAAGVYGVHDLRYRLPSGDGSHALEAHGHGHLSLVAPLVALLLILAGGHLLWLLARGEGAGSSSRSTRRLWATATLALLGAFLAQELIEGALAADHPAGFAGVFGAGGWLALPLAVLLGGGIALLLRGADEVLRASARLDTLDTRPCAVLTPVFRSLSRSRLWRSSPLARRGAGRAPPLVCV